MCLLFSHAFCSFRWEGASKILIVLLTSRLCSKVVQHFASMNFHLWIGLIATTISICNDYNCNICNQWSMVTLHFFLSTRNGLASMDQHFWWIYKKMVVKCFLSLHFGCAPLSKYETCNKTEWKGFWEQQACSRHLVYYNVHCVFESVLKHKM